MTSNLSVKVTADVVDLQTKFGIAKAETNALSAEFNKLARASAAGTIDAGGSARLQQLAGDLLATRTQMQGYASQLQAAGFAQNSFNRQMEGGHGSISTATREFRALFDELSSGRTRQTPGTLAIIAQRVLGLGPAALGAVAGILALAGGLGYLVYRSLEAKNALDQMQIGAAFAGNMDVSRRALEQFSNELAQARGISASDAREIVWAFASMHDLSAAQIHALEAVVADFAQSTGQKATEAKDALVKAFSDKTSAVEYARSLGAVTQAQIDSAQQADRSGNAQQVFAAKFELLNEALARSRSVIDQHNSSLTSSIATWLKYFGVVQTANGIESGQQKLIEDTNAARATQLKLLEQIRTEMATAPHDTQQEIKSGVSTAEKENPVSIQADEAKAKIAEMTRALLDAQAVGDQLSINKLNAGLQKAREDLSNLQFGPVLERMREQMEQVASTWDGTQSGLLAKQQQIAAQALTGVTQNSKEYLAIKQEEATKEVEIRRAVSSEAVAAARTQIAALTGDAGTTQRLEAEQQIWAQLLAGDQINKAAREEVQRSFNADAAAIARERVAETAAITKSDVGSDLAISRMQIEAAKETADGQVAATKQAVAQKYAALKTFADQEFALDLQALQNEISALKQGTPQYEQVYNQIRELKERLVLDLAKLDEQEAQASKKAAEEQASDWKKAVGEITSAESGLVNDVLTKRKSLSQSLEAIGAQLVQQEIANDLKAMTMRVLMYKEADVQEKALKEGGFLYHQAIELLKTGATKTNVTAQVGAVTTGNTEQQTSDVSAAAAGRALQASTGPAQVMADAAVAAAGGMASVAAIPYVGWAMAPGVGAELFSTVSAFAGPAALDVGTNYVPQDMIAQIHQGEAVVPKEYNPAAGGQAPGGAGDITGDTHNYGGIGAVNVSSTDLKRMLSSRSAQRDVINTLAGAVRRGVRPR
jgi:hypothetical protein